jgi:hypothetical protein
MLGGQPWGRCWRWNGVTEGQSILRDKRVPKNPVERPHQKLRRRRRGLAAEPSRVVALALASRNRADPRKAHGRWSRRSLRTAAARFRAAIIIVAAAARFRLGRGTDRGVRCGARQRKANGAGTVADQRQANDQAAPGKHRTKIGLPPSVHSKHADTAACSSGENRMASRTGRQARSQISGILYEMPPFPAIIGRCVGRFC